MFTIAVRLIFPAFDCAWSSGRTLSIRHILIVIRESILRRIGWIDNSRLLCRLVCHQVGIVVALPGPCVVSIASDGRDDIHIGSDWTCMVLDCGRLRRRRTLWNGRAARMKFMDG